MKFKVGDLVVLIHCDRVDLYLDNMCPYWVISRASAGFYGIYDPYNPSVKDDNVEFERLEDHCQLVPKKNVKKILEEMEIRRLAAL